MNTDRQNLSLLLNKLSEQYKGKIKPKSCKLTSVNLAAKALEFGIEFTRDLSDYGVLVPGLEGALAEINRDDIVGRYIQVDNGLIVPNRIKHLVNLPSMPYIPPKEVYIALK